MVIELLNDHYWGPKSREYIKEEHARQELDQSKNHLKIERNDVNGIPINYLTSLPINNTVSCLPVIPGLNSFPGVSELESFEKKQKLGDMFAFQSSLTKWDSNNFVEAKTYESEFTSLDETLRVSYKI